MLLSAEYSRDLEAEPALNLAGLQVLWEPALNLAGLQVLWEPSNNGTALRYYSQLLVMIPSWSLY